MWPWLCNSSPNHAVTAIGFNLDNKTPYFRIKNSWGTKWGETGYFRMAKGSGKGYCGLSGHEWNYYPVL